MAKKEKGIDDKEPKKEKKSDHQENVEPVNSGKDQENQPETENGSEEVLLLSKSEVDELKNNLEKARKKEQENLESWQRERADFINYKKRIEREQTQNGQNYKAELLKKYLVIMDDLDLAIRNKPQNHPEDNSWVEGIELIARKLHSIFENEGLEKMECEGNEFDPNLHQAISYEEHSDVESGKIIEVIQSGYKLGDRVIRPALVRVAQ
ncbi:MAG: nucleotide exchange factor GrpE [Flexilinea flocculi]|jgi:molecular chaperone GrpE|nr:nucleotide exchange factor GrpE [Flexilinea flocculi]